jgi:phospholipid transport system substrate-binding protein
MKIVTYGILILLFSFSQAQAISETDELKEYIEKLINDGEAILKNNTLSEAEKDNEMSVLIKDHLYSEWMAKQTLGRHRRSIAKDKLDEFFRIYSQFVINSYVDLSNNYNNEKAVVKNIKQIDDNMFIINVEIIKPSGQLPIKVEYLVHKRNDGNVPYLIGDIITEGISILNSQQAEFDSIISNEGIDALIDHLRDRLNSGKKKFKQAKSNIIRHDIEYKLI